MEKTNQKILFIALAVFSASIIFSMDEVYAQSSATVTLFETGNTADDECKGITQTGSVIWIACNASASSTVNIRAMSGNTTIASIVAGTIGTSGIVLYPTGTNTIVTLDLSGATAEIVREYTLTGSTITNSASLTLTGCINGLGSKSGTQMVGTSLYIVCNGGTETGKIKVVNSLSMVLSNTLTTLIQGGCAAPQSFSMASTTKGVVFCDATEAYLFSVSGTTITFEDSLTGWNSITSFRETRFTGQTGADFTVWTTRYTGLQPIEVATVDFENMLWDSGITTVPSQGDPVGMLAVSVYIFTIDATDENMLVYDWRDTQPSTAKANFSGGGLLITSDAGFAQGFDGVSLLIAISVTDKGRFYTITEIIIDGNELGDTPNDPFDTGIDCDDPAHSYKLICNIPTGGIPTNVGNATGTALIFLGCQVVFQTCEDTNPQTNGMGLLAFIASLFVVVGMFYYVLGTDRVANIPLFVWVLIVIALSAFFTITGWIDPTFLIISIVVVIAMAAPKVIKMIRGDGGTMGEGSTE